MKSKKGFFLIELMVGLLLSIFFIVIISDYIIKIRSSQQNTLKEIESFSAIRNEKEKELSRKIE